LACFTIGSLLVPSSAVADEVLFGPSKDNTLYEDSAGSISNGAGQYMFAGRVALAGGGRTRRAVIAFPVADFVPADSTITTVTLTLWMSRTPAGDQPVALHRLTSDWGEGTSDAPLEEGGGTAATQDDATWRHTFFNTEFWNSSGGDFVTAPSGSMVIGGIGSYTWPSTPQMVQDVQDWLDDPDSNFGWLLLGNEESLATSKRFNTREFVDDPSKQPVLTIAFTPAGGCVDNTDCADDSVCTFDRCLDGKCHNDITVFGDVASPRGACGPDGSVDLVDILAVLNGFAGQVAAGCTIVNVDLASPGDTCRPGGGVDLLDILAVLDAFAGTASCCP